ncbi:hypothetical protein Vadar_029292 [Vaccinium darrowii]|uniref:Uncharacterized protein n=1 Tax=Vaccinium darrowii TaxID=229202 RepID=A0ACB7XVJ1_9ERIC|nr:hypothetical protein Vadar_029292 [Vaccinium darrowii]
MLISQRVKLSYINEAQEKADIGDAIRSLTFNIAITQYAADALPLGGVGESFGRNHGKFSFNAFTHMKAVAKRNFVTNFWFRLSPWNDLKLELFRSAYHYDYLDVALITLGLKKKS